MDIKFIGNSLYTPFDLWKQIIKDGNASQTVTLGNFGDRSKWIRYFEEIDTDKHVVFTGPRDYHSSSNTIHDSIMSRNIFCIRGGATIYPEYYAQSQDTHDYFPEEEEIHVNDWTHVRDKYISYIPNIVCSHDPPLSVEHSMFDESRGSDTSERLDVLLSLHKPQYWAFSSFNENKISLIKGTLFISVKDEITLTI